MSKTVNCAAAAWKPRVRHGAVLALSLVACAAMDREALAVENGNPQWPIGVQTIIPAILPAAGETAYFNYTLYYHADSFKGANGNDLIPGFEANVLAEAPRIVHTWEAKLGPFNMSTGAILVGNFVKVEADPVPGVRLKDSVTGLNFLYLTPLYLTYNTPTLHLLYGPSAIIPVGHFSEHDLANPTNNYYSFHQEFAFTYFPKKNLEISTEGGLTFNAENPDTNYQSGATFDIDWGVNWAPIASMPNLFFGLQGFYVTQFTDDEVNDVTVRPGGFRLEKIALGPQLIYYFSPKAGICAKYQREFDTKNGPEGDRYWVQFVFPIGRK